MNRSIIELAVEIEEMRKSIKDFNKYVNIIILISV